MLSSDYSRFCQNPGSGNRGKHLFLTSSSSIFISRWLPKWSKLPKPPRNHLVRLKFAVLRRTLSNMRADDLPDEITQHYIHLREMPDGRLCGVMKLLFHWTLHIDIDFVGYEDRYCYRTAPAAIEALMNWDGTGDPVGWHRHPKTGRRRDLETDQEWVQW